MAAICVTWFTVMVKRLDKETIHNYEVPLTMLVTSILFLTATSSIFLLKGFLRPCDLYKVTSIVFLIATSPIFLLKGLLRPCDPYKGGICCSRVGNDELEEVRWLNSLLRKISS
ncbi:hypothetical protein CCACVL1_07507 [Corchorus capsularis]|uniref:Uncharacterized protein n=1 Tax=Corchorus capsularis TaxID=210143 RepID=A0A1R3J5K5_COCAP|nr:hypothetical protein CCACVL1_07507 [Corchorus capsularis]